MTASTSNATSTNGPSCRPSMRSNVDVCTACPSKLMVQVSNGSTQRKASGPAPSTVGRPSGPAGGQLGPSARNR